MSRSKMSVTDAIRVLEQASSFGLGPQPTQREMLKTIEKVEGQYTDTDSAELQCWLGTAWRCYTAWFIRGEARKPYLEKVLSCFEKAHTIESRNSGIKRDAYAVRLGSLLVEEALVRDLDRGIELLESVFGATSDYTPQFCHYAEALYKSGDYERAAFVATELHKRAIQSKEWKSSVPPAPMRIAAKAYRALVRGFEKGGNIRDAVEASTRLLDTGSATDNDRKVHTKLTDVANSG